MGVDVFFVFFVTSRRVASFKADTKTVFFFPFFLRPLLFFCPPSSARRRSAPQPPARVRAGVPRPPHAEVGHICRRLERG